MGFINYLINGISLGSVYAIIALGYTMVYGIAKMLNFGGISVCHLIYFAVGGRMVVSALLFRPFFPSTMAFVRI